MESPAESIAGREALQASPLDGLLFEGVPLTQIARAHGTPTWVYGAGTLRTRFRRLRAAMPGVAIHYAVKALDHLAILAILAEEGAGADVVSAGELIRARRAGIPPDRIIFSGVGKTAPDLALALDHDIAQINVESAEELHLLSAIAAARGTRARVALRINPDVDAGTHAKISTGRAGDKFGIPIAQAASLYAEAAALPGITAQGLAVHIGSQINRTAPFTAAYTRLADLVRQLRQTGHRVATLDCGGGLAIPYNGEPQARPEAWAAAIQSAFGGLDLHLAIAPGRWLVGPAGILLASVIRTRRHGQARPIVVLDAAMNDLARPALYDSWHAILPVAPGHLTADAEPTDIVGPVCESSDILARARPLAPLPDNAFVAILDAGAYGAVMSSTYNARPQAAQVLVDARAGQPAGFTLIRPRQTIETLWRDEILPEPAGA